MANFLVTKDLMEEELAGKKAASSSSSNKTESSLFTAFNGLTISGKTQTSLA